MYRTYVLTSYNLHPHTMSVHSVNGKADYTEPKSSWAFPEQVGWTTEPLTYLDNLSGLLGAGGEGTIILLNVAIFYQSTRQNDPQNLKSSVKPLLRQQISLWAVPDWNLGQYTGCPDISHGFPQYLQQNIWLLT